MSKNKHTPGPWKINAFGEIADCNNDGVAEILYRSIERTPKAEAEESANMLLITSAPDLLASGRLALMALEYVMEHGGDRGAPGVALAVEELRKAIAKTEEAS